MKDSKSDGNLLKVDDVVRRTLGIVPDGCSVNDFCKGFKKASKLMFQERSNERKKQMKDEQKLKEKQRKEQDKMETNDFKSKVNINISCCTIQ